MRILCFFQFLFFVSCISGVLGVMPSILIAQDAFDKEHIEKKYVLGPEDVINIKVWNHKDLTQIIEIPEEGSFTYPHLGSVKAEGLSVFELEDLLEQRLADGYIKSPQVSVTVNKYKSKKVFVLGHVKRPGIYMVKGETHILELISQAGGFTSKAGRSVTIVRPKSSIAGKPVLSHEEDDENIKFTIDLGKYAENSRFTTFVIHSDDYIYVNKKSVFYVTGPVRKQGKFDWERDLTVRQAITLAGGFTPLASRKRVKIIRIINKKEKTIKVKMSDIVKPDDVIEVPERRF